MRYHRFLARIEILSAITLQVQRTDGGGPSGPHDVVVPAGSYYVLDDGSADCLLEAIEDAVQGAGAPFSTFHVHRTTESDETHGPGVVFFEAGNTVVIVVTWNGSAAGQELRDKLRFSGNTTTLDGGSPSTAYAGRVHFGGFYPIRPVSGDMPRGDWRRTKLRQDAGGTRKEVHVYETIERIGISVLYGGPPRGDGTVDARRRNEWNSWYDLAEDVLRAESILRWYQQDPSGAWVTDPYDRIDEPWGYEVVTHDAPDSYAPAQMQPGNSTLFRDRITLQRAEEPT